MAVTLLMIPTQHGVQAGEGGFDNAMYDHCFKETRWLGRRSFYVYGQKQCRRFVLGSR
jgi:hypothetical protein